MRNMTGIRSQNVVIDLFFQRHLDYIFRHVSLVFPQSLKHACVRGNERRALKWERALNDVHAE